MRIWKAKAYLRLSKEDNDKTGEQESNSISNQRDLIAEFVKTKEDIALCGERCDDGYSGVTFDRPSFNALLEDIRDGSIDCVIVKDLSRFGRNHIEAGKYIEQLFPLLGVRFIAINDGFDSLKPRTESDNILIPFKNLVNDTYCRDISIKIRSQFEIKRKKGQFVGAFVAYGYVKDSQCKNKLLIDDNVADYIREIFRLKLFGMSADGIAKRFNAMGIPSPLEYKKMRGENFVSNFNTKNESKWSATSILRILKNPLYVGTLVQGKEGTPNHKIRKKKVKPQSEWVVVEHNHEPIISLETFNNVQKALKMDTRTSPDEESVYLFSGLLYCGNCGESIIRKTIPSSKKKYIYYVCGGNKKNKSCSGKGIREEVLTNAVFVSVKHRIDEILNMESLMSVIDTGSFVKIKVKNLRRALSEKEKEIERVNRFKKGLYEAYIDKTVSKSDYETFYLEYENQYNELLTQADTLKAEIELTSAGNDEYSTWINNFKKYHNITQLNRAIVVDLIEKIRIYDKQNIEIVFRYQNEYEIVLQALEYSAKDNSSTKGVL